MTVFSVDGSRSCWVLRGFRGDVGRYAGSNKPSCIKPSCIRGVPSQRPSCLHSQAHASTEFSPYTPPEDVALKEQHIGVRVRRGLESWPFSFGFVVVHSHFCCRFCSYRHLGMTLQGLCRFGIKVMYNGFGFSNLGWAGSRHPRTCHLAGSTCSWTAPGGHARSAWRASRTT